MWNERNNSVEFEEAEYDDESYYRHLYWLRGEYRLYLKPAWTDEDCLELEMEFEADNEYNMGRRETDRKSVV